MADKLGCSGSPVLIFCVDLSTVMHRGPKIASELKRSSRITKTDVTNSSSSYGGSTTSPRDDPGHHQQRRTSAASTGSGGVERERSPAENGRYTKQDSTGRLDAKMEPATRASSIRERATAFQATTASSSSSSSTAHSAGTSNICGALDADSVSLSLFQIYFMQFS